MQLHTSPTIQEGHYEVQIKFCITFGQDAASSDGAKCVSMIDAGTQIDKNRVHFLRKTNLKTKLQTSTISQKFPAMLVSLLSTCPI